MDFLFIYIHGIFFDVQIYIKFNNETWNIPIPFCIHFIYIIITKFYNIKFITL